MNKNKLFHFRDKLEKDQVIIFSIFSEMSKNGFVTFCDNNNYAKGALVLARSLRHVGTSADLVCLITNNISDEFRSQVIKLLTLYKEIVYGSFLA